jgi:inner membrane protein
VDSITHALLIATLLTAVGAPGLIVFGIFGAVILDIDILFHLVSSKRPTLYMLIHGGAAHSIAGATGMAVLAYGTLFLIMLAGENFLHFTPPLTFNLLALSAVITGALLHVILDFLASPGIPLFWPQNDTKYTLAVFAGPSAVMILVSWTFVILLIAGIVQISGLIFYGILFLLYLTVSITIRIAAAIRISGKTLPTINPFRWLTIEKYRTIWSLKTVNLLTGSEFVNGTWVALEGVTQGDIDKVSGIPEVRRVAYNSLFTIARRLDNGDIVIMDPSRIEGIVRYPPYYESVNLKQSEQGNWEVVTN